MVPSHYTRFVLNERPVRDIVSNTFRSEELPLSSLKPGNEEVLVQVTWLSLDPAMRGWLNDTRSYVPPVQIGEVMRAGGLGVVIETGEGSKFKVGETVSGVFGMS